ncbi:MAG: hypothetical protein B7Y25_01065 [Alphaproteobacteria bacterium 16-39-46]|nr:MAG: hypothetical protein B7Y25_01065 [Alphaproteobacteria bacterium 16-39-46]OZA44212.1 MAG: hypothetical protein B7X84_01145 [Alphaproteobacteria bacterium 17-39-52]HQS83658.1 hypothetical protein [Alphaproteobacteria bacterium]HQS93402.1 hypothetical protein [Alphaproteobacteria bacterium]
MDWTQTLTIILTIGALAAALTAALWHLSKEDMKLVREDMKRHDEEFSKMREEFSKRDNLWANLLQKIHNVDKKFYILEKQIFEIKLDQSRKA